MKQLIEEQKKGIYNIIAKLDNGTHSSNQLQGTDEALWNWHKQSLKQFIDGLIAFEEGRMVVLRDKEDHLPNAYQWLKGKNEARQETLAHLKKLKEELTN